MKILIVEDEKLAVDKLLQVLNKVNPDAEVIGVTDSISSSVSWIDKHQDEIDLILMDIELADGQSFAIFEQIDIKRPVIFVTSYDEYALRAFKVNSIDYLLKPIQPNELKHALEKFEAITAVFRSVNTQSLNIENLVRELQKNSSKKEYRKRFLVKHLQKLVSIDVATICCFYFEDRVTFFKTFDGKNYILDYTLDEVEGIMDPDIFFRINRGLMVAMKSVDQIQPYFGNRLALRLKPDFEKEVIVSREKVNDFKVWMGK
jgi:two-component system response regulator LytT